MNLFNSYYDTSTRTLYGTHNSGFYSCINCLRISLYKLISLNIIPESLSLIHSLYLYRDYSDIDFYNVLYKKNNEHLNLLKPFDSFEMFCPTLNSHKDLNLNFFTPIEKVFFSPSDSVVQTMEKFLLKYNIDTGKTLAVLHRGNDKWKEAKLSSPSVWIDVIESKYEKGDRILIQTDEERFKNIMLEYFGERCFFIEEMIFGDDYNNNIRPMGNKVQWAINFEAVMRIISNCKKIVNHTGNCALVPIVYRGSLKGEVQIFNNDIIDYDKLP